MKIAVPLFRERISPHFGSSSKILLMETDGFRIYQEAECDMEGKGPLEIARRLVDLGVEKVICGGIHYYYKEWLIRKGMTVVDNQKGVAREVIQGILGLKG